MLFGVSGAAVSACCVVFARPGRCARSHCRRRLCGGRSAPQPPREGVFSRAPRTTVSTRVSSWGMSLAFPAKLTKNCSELSTLAVDPRSASLCTHGLLPDMVSCIMQVQVHCPETIQPFCLPQGHALAASSDILRQSTCVKKGLSAHAASRIALYHGMHM